MSDCLRVFAVNKFPRLFLDTELTGQQQRVSELLADSRLNLRVGGKIDAARGLVEDDDRAAPKERPRHGNELPLTLGEVRTAGGDFGVQRECRLALAFRM